MNARDVALSTASAQNQMQFQERMSSTAHQRETQDLIAAGLNPVLSAKLGGASTPSGAAGDYSDPNTGKLIDAVSKLADAMVVGAGQGPNTDFNLQNAIETGNWSGFIRDAGEGYYLDLPGLAQAVLTGNLQDVTRYIKQARKDKNGNYQYYGIPLTDIYDAGSSVFGSDQDNSFQPNSAKPLQAYKRPSDRRLNIDLQNQIYYYLKDKGQWFKGLKFGYLNNYARKNIYSDYHKLMAKDYINSGRSAKEAWKEDRANAYARHRTNQNKAKAGR